MKKVISKILIISMLALIVSNNCFAHEMAPEEKAREALESNKEWRPKELKESYKIFNDIVAAKLTFENVAMGWSFFNENNDKLMIGCSGVVYCGHMMKSEKLLKYGYDLVGFGGIFDDEVIELLKRIEDKKYKTIVIFGGVNDVNLRASFNFYDIDLYYCETLIELITEARKHLKDEDGNVYYIKIKPMKYNIDSTDERFVNRFNNMAKQINDNVELYGYKSYEVLNDTDSKNPKHYVHYDNVAVYEEMFETID